MITEDLGINYFYMRNKIRNMNIQSDRGRQGHPGPAFRMQTRTQGSQYSSRDNQVLEGMNHWPTKLKKISVGVTRVSLAQPIPNTQRPTSIQRETFLVLGQPKRVTEVWIISKTTLINNVKEHRQQDL